MLLGLVFLMKMQYKKRNDGHINIKSIHYIV